MGYEPLGGKLTTRPTENMADQSEDDLDEPAASAEHVITTTDPEQTEEAQLLAAPPPAPIEDLAHACVRFVERAVGVKLDFTPDTLPLLDHYLLGARKVTAETEETSGAVTQELVAQAAGAYFGEVVRRRYASWWRLGASADDHRLEFHRASMVAYPVAMMKDALSLEDEPTTLELTGFELDDADRSAAMRRLDEFPDVSAEDFVRPSTRFEVLEVVVDAARGRQLASGEPPLELERADYVH